MNKQTTNQQRQAGFTLLELLVAISVFTVLSIMAYGGLSTVINTKQHLEQSTVSFNALQNTLLLMGQDLLLANNRVIRDEFGSEQPAFFAPLGQKDILTFTRSSLVPSGVPESKLQRISYQLEDGKLYRVIWPVLDRMQSTTPYTQELLSDVKSVNLQMQGRSRQSPLPRVVRVTIHVEGIGQVQRLLPVTL